MTRRAWRALWPSWVDRNLRIILVARTSMSVARAIAGVVAVLYLAAEGFSALAIGVLFLVVTLASALMSTMVGLLSDRVGRKPFLVVVPLLTAAAAVVFSFERAPALLFVFGALGSFGRGAGAGGGTVGPYQPAEAAMVAEGVPRWARTAAFGRLAFTSTLGALVGGLLAGLAHTHPHMSLAGATAAYRPAFLAAAVLAGTAGIVALWLHEPAHDPPGEPAHAPLGEPAHDPPGEPAHAPTGEPAHAPTVTAVAQRRRDGLSWPRRSWPALWRLSTTNAVNGMGMGMVGPFLSYWLARRYGASPGTIGLLFAMVNAGTLASTLAAAGIARRLGTIRAIVGVRAIGGLLMIPMVLAPTFWLAGAVFFVRMLAQRVGLPLRQSFTQDVAHPDERASVAALSTLPAQGTMAGSQVLAGYLFDEVGLAAPFELAAVFQLANAVLYGVLFGWAKPRGPADRVDQGMSADPGLPGSAADRADHRGHPSHPGTLTDPPGDPGTLDGSPFAGAGKPPVPSSRSPASS